MKKKNIAPIIDFEDYTDYDILRDNLNTQIVKCHKIHSPFQQYIFKSFKLKSQTSKDQKTILQAFYQSNGYKSQYILCYSHYSFFSFQSDFIPTFSRKYITSKPLEEVFKDKDFRRKWTITDALNCLFAVTQGMLFLHSHLIYHGNLCPSNIIVDTQDQCYIVDFGLYPIKRLYYNAKDLFDDDFKDPIIKTHEPGFKNDVYSFGVLMSKFCLLFFQSDVYQTLNDYKTKFDKKKFRFLPSIFSDLIPKCLTSTPTERPSFQQILDIFQTSKIMIGPTTIHSLFKEFSKKIYIEELAKSKDSYALNKLGIMYEKGEIVEKNAKKAIECYKASADLGNSNAQNNLGLLLQNEPDEKSQKKGADLLKMAAEQGNIQAMANYGVVLNDGIGCNRDEKTARQYLKKSADHGFDYAQDNYGFGILNDKNPTPEQINEGLRYIKMAMNQNYPDAFYTYGIILYYGKVVEQNYKLALDYFKIAAEMGHLIGMMDSAECYLKGIGCDVDVEKALHYLHMAADLGYEKAIDEIKKLSESGQISSEIAVDQQNSSEVTTPTKKDRKKKVKKSAISSSPSKKESDSNNQTDPVEIEKTKSPKKSSKSKVQTESIEKETSKSPKKSLKSKSKTQNQIDLIESEQTKTTKKVSKSKNQTDSIESEQTKSPKKISKTKNQTDPIESDQSKSTKKVSKSKNQTDPIQSEQTKSPKKISKTKNQTDSIESDQSKSTKKVSKSKNQTDLVESEPTKSPKKISKSKNQTDLIENETSKSSKKSSQQLDLADLFNFQLNKSKSQPPHQETSTNEQPKQTEEFSQQETTTDEQHQNKTIQPSIQSYIDLISISSSSSSDDDEQSILNSNPTKQTEEEVAATTTTSSSYSSLLISESNSKTGSLDSNENQSTTQTPPRPQPPTTEDKIHSQLFQSIKEKSPFKWSQKVPTESSEKVLKPNNNNVNDDSDYSSISDSDTTDDDGDSTIPPEAKILIKQGDEMIEEGNSQRAIAYYESAAKNGYPRAYLKCVEICDEIENKLAYYELAIKNNVPEAFSEWRKCILKHLAFKKEPSYLIQFAKRFEKFDDFSDAADIYRRSKDRLNFMNCYEKAKENSDKILDGWQQFYFANLLERQNEYDKAIEMYKKAFKNGVPKAEKKIDELLNK